MFFFYFINWEVYQKSAGCLLYSLHSRVPLKTPPQILFRVAKDASAAKLPVVGGAGARREVRVKQIMRRRNYKVRTGRQRPAASARNGRARTYFTPTPSRIVGHDS